MSGRPKQPQSAFLLFMNKTRKNVADEYPEMKPNDIASLVGEVWKGLTP